jgi:hypothetical protein
MSLSQAQRREVHKRAGECCEYCRLPEADTAVAFHVDHFIPHNHSLYHLSSASTKILIYFLNVYNYALIRAPFASHNGSRTTLAGMCVPMISMSNTVPILV